MAAQKYLVNFATLGFLRSQWRLNKSAKKFGIDKTISYFAWSIKNTSFYKENKKILDQKRGSGLWLWKPYIILETLNNIKHGDFLIYADSGIEVIADLSPLSDISFEKGAMLFICPSQINKTWTRRDCFVLMDCDEEKYWSGQQTNGAFQCFIKNDKNIDFVREWLRYCQNPNVLADIPNICGKPNFPEFKDHRHDQSVLSLLAIKYQQEIFRDPSQWGNYIKMQEFRVKGEFIQCPYSDEPYINSPYTTLFDHHRRHD